MATAVATGKKYGPPWWLVLMEGILAIIVGILLWMYPVRAFVTLSVFIGFYWIFDGIFDLVSIFMDRTMWGWKLFMGIIAIIAGLFLVDNALRGAAALASTTAIIVGFMGIFYGIMGLIRGFQGAGWGAALLGVVSIIFGIYILTNLWAATLAIPWVFGALAIVGGISAIVLAFRMK